MTPEEAVEYNKNLKMYMKISDKQNPCKFLEENYIALDMAIEALKEQRPHSEWLPVTDWDGGILAYKCKTCGWYKPHNVLPFCENCGADMRKEGEQNE